MIEGQNLKKSHYSFFIPKDDGSYLVYNSLTGVIISIHSEDKLEQLQQIMDQDLVSYNSDDEMISFFSNKGVLVESDKDEFEYTKYCYERDVVKDTSLVLTLITTRQCNLRCIYCYEEHEDKPMEVDVYEGLLNFITEALKSKKYTSVSLSLFGGEPFIEYDNLVGFLEKSKEICNEYEAGFNISATSNGALIYPERFEKLIDLGCTYYQITVDGFAETHDKYRINANGSGSWDTIINNLKYMNSTEHKFKVTVRTNFNEEVFKRAEAFYEFVNKNFDGRFSVYYEGIKKLGGEHDENLNVLDAENASSESVNIAKAIHELNIKNDVVDSMTRPFSRVCYATKHNNFIVDYDGSILKCTLSLEEDSNRIGYITKEGQMVLDETKHSLWLVKRPCWLKSASLVKSSLSVLVADA